VDNTTNNSTSLLTGIWRGLIIIILVISLITPVRSVQAALLFTVNTNSDLGDAAPGDSICATSGGNCSLRAAVQEMNAYAPVTGGEINFTDDYTISLASHIQLLADNVIITGSEHAVTIIGPSSDSTIALWLSGNGGQIDHLTIKNPPDLGVPYDQGGYGIYIAPSGSHPGSNYLIDHVTFLSSYNGVMIYGGSNNTIQYSLFGTTQISPTSCVETERNRYGIYLNNFAHDNLIQNNQIVCDKEYGSSIMDVQSIGTSISANTIAGNLEVGIDLYGSNDTTIIQNFIGNQGGTIEFANGVAGIKVEGGSSNTTIGGSGSTDGNIISGNISGYGILIHDNANNITIDRNLIGLDSFHNPMPNFQGIAIWDANHVTIGSTDHTAYQQYISSNSAYGIHIGNADHISILDNNIIGISNPLGVTDPDNPSGNGMTGIMLNTGSSYISIDAWKIAYNGWKGIVQEDNSSQHNTLLPKNIYRNRSLPIDIGDDGSTPGYPVISDVAGSTITGTTCPGCDVYFYRAIKNPGANGGGGLYNLGMTPAHADSETGVWSTTLPEGIFPEDITMLTYDGANGQTSEFSPVPYSPDLIVNTDNDEHDAVPGNSFCETSPGNETCSLRAAVEELNAYGAGGTIDFSPDLTAYNINLGGPISITVDDVSINGEGHAVTLTYSPSAYFEPALLLAANGGRVEYLTIKSDDTISHAGYAISIGEPGIAPGAIGNSYTVDHITALNSNVGIAIFGNVDGSRGSNNNIQNNLIGLTESTLNTLIGSVDPISPADDCNTAEMNGYGIYVDGSTNNIFLGNQVVCNDYYGIWISNSKNAIISGNTIAGTINYDGTLLENVDTAMLTGNFIGNLAGTIEFPNDANGILVSDNSSNIIIGFTGSEASALSANLTIGGSWISAGNIISGNEGDGILIQTNSHDILIDGNLIGLDANLNPMPNVAGVAVSNSQDVTIGSGDHNLMQQYISGNDYFGVVTYYANHVFILDDNLIGLAGGIGEPSTDIPAGNGCSGVALLDFSTYVDVSAWKIAYNGWDCGYYGWDGISVYYDSTSLNNSLLPLNVYGNHGLPIDLGVDGFTPNDPVDADTGPNDLLNYPVITSVNESLISGQACAYCTVYFYRVVSNPGASGAGARYNLDMLPVIADGIGNWHATLPAGVTPWNITMVTYQDSTNQTSEFSPINTTFIPMVIRP